MFAFTSVKSATTNNIKAEAKMNGNMYLTNVRQKIYTKINKTKVQIKKPSKTCSGEWFYTDSTGKIINLGREDLSSWDQKSKPSILEETLYNNNIVLLGHNNCENGDCYKPTTDFGKIIISRVNDKAAACINGLLYEGKVIFSAPVNESATFILDNWLNKNTITAFTCYGECYDEECTNVKQRWVIAFEY